jgi:hypothetical protein
MPGSTINTDLLSATNQLIQAVNELSTATSSQDLSVTVNNSSSCGCPPTTDYPPITEPLDGTEETPPPGYGPQDSQIDDRKCKVANYSVAQLQYLIDQFVIYNIDVWAGVGVSAVLAALILALPVATIGVFLGGMLGKLGWLVGIAKVIVTSTVSLDTLQTALATYYDELVCAHYDATDTQVMIDNVVDVLETGGVSAANVLLVEAILTFDWLATQYFDHLDYSIEAELDGYTPASDCEDCTAFCPDYWLQIGNTSDGITFEGIPYAGYYSMNLHTSYNPGIPGYCSPVQNHLFTCTNPVNITYRGSDYIYNVYDVISETYTYQGNTPPSGVCGTYIVVQSSTSFYIDVAYSTECTI